MTPERTTRRLTRDIVVEEALAVLDEGGYEALTIRRLAERLGVVPMAVYRHVTSKDDLTDALVDLAVSRVPLPDPGLDWRDGLRQLAHAIRNTILRHPGVNTPLVTKPALGPSSLVLAEFGFDVMRSAGFHGDDTTRSVNSIVTYTIGFTALEVPRRLAGFEADGTGATALDVAFDQLAPNRFPHTVELRPAPAELVSNEQFEYGLERLLDGIAEHGPGVGPDDG
jgi:TetR/AcrR family tetracycline transcriptional repressor